MIDKYSKHGPSGDTPVKIRREGGSHIRAYRRNENVKMGPGHPVPGPRAAVKEVPTPRVGIHPEDPSCKGKHGDWPKHWPYACADIPLC